MTREDRSNLNIALAALELERNITTGKVDTLEMDLQYAQRRLAVVSTEYELLKKCLDAERTE